MERRPGQPSLTVVGDCPGDNRLLSALPDAVLQRFLPGLQRVDLAQGAVLYESGGLLDYVCFPTSSIVSLLYVTEDGASAEIAVVGREGMLGVALFMGGNTMPNRAVVQGTGQAFRMRARALTEAFETSLPVMHLCLRYAQALITQIAQTAVCNRHHALDEQLSRWLLTTLDRSTGDEVRMTQELISGMLGVRRESVTTSASRLQAKGLIRYARGHIRVLDRGGLERQACECYSVVRREYDRLLPAMLAG
jgi:CRP-like cAMP-binding protein